MTNFTREIARLYRLIEPSEKMGELDLEEVTKPLEKLLFSLIADRSKLHEIAEQSYIHDLGFIKLVLSTSPELRLHFWNDSPRLRQTNIHNHTADFGSYVLYGKLRQELFRQSKVQLGALPDLFQVFRCGSTKRNSYKMNQLGSGYLERTSDEEIMGPRSYYLTNDFLHRVTSQVETVTLLAQGPRKRNYTNVWSKSEWPDSVQVKKLKPELVSYLSKKLLEELRNRYE